MITLSEKAYQKVKQLIEESNYDSTYFLKVVNNNQELKTFKIIKN